ncbi:hypothetical protein ACTJK9_01040 [Pseudomonas sp. 22082]|uniref:hypothetical protein n=1 Tax=Pseudomonas sp. 22082 TaxID=3453868 RepID=UPI003F82F2F1
MDQFVHFVEVENKFEETWSYECEPLPNLSIDSIAYLLFSDKSGFWLGEVSRWSDVRQIKNKKRSQRWVFEFGRGRGFGSHATDLLNLCHRSLTASDFNKIDGYFSSSHSLVEEADIKSALALNLSDAREAIANYYRVESRQVEILIRSN